jgi:Flp pilus assembly protein CpaB
MLEQLARTKRIDVPRWINARTFLGLLLFCGAFLASQRVITKADQSFGVWVAARDLSQDTELNLSDLKSVNVDMPRELLERYSRNSVAIEGSVLTTSVRAGELLPVDWITAKPVAEKGRSITIPVSPDHALGGELSAGDRIDVFATFESSTEGARTVQIARDITVLGVVTAGGLVAEDDSAVGVTVAVSPETALTVAHAVRTGEIDLAEIHNGLRESKTFEVVTEDIQ